MSRGVEREVTAEGMEYPHVVEAFTLPEAARALGRTELTLRRWLEEDMLPAPLLHDTSRHYRQYSVGELEVIARELKEHEREFTYYARTHHACRERIMQHVFAYRQLHI